MVRILVVDDQPHVTYVLGLFLTRRGYDVTRASDGKRALELMDKEPFDLLITDVDMPNMDGLSLVAELDAIDRLRAVIILTGRSDYETIERFEGRRNVRVAPKPFSPSRIAEAVEELLALQPLTT